ncbi:hypothetical protein [Brachybacterium sp. FME24]|uniref:hypothetical protein n=1 Tax=Brachybacterium sp. FME24 TaxID=2742605 RepID=UPI0018692C8B|nr:hypothetical protein [Brachybacterium sp. FME24]
MSLEPGSAQDPRDVDAEFARMLEDEGMVLRPGEAPREPAAQDPVDPWDSDAPGTGVADDDLWSYSADSPPEAPSAESRARARAAHPSAGARDGIDGLRGAAGPRELDDDEVIYGDFEPPDPDLPQPSSGALWSWTALIGGFLLMLVATVTPTVPSILGAVGGLAAVGGVVSLLIRVPRSRDGDDNGAEV